VKSNFTSNICQARLLAIARAKQFTPVRRRSIMANVTNPARKSDENTSFGSQSGSHQGGQSGASSGSQQDRLGAAASTVAERGKEAANYVADKAKSAASTLQHSAEGAASYVGTKAGDATSAVGSGLKSLGDTIRESGPKGDMMKGATCAVADTLDQAGQYLQEEGLSGIAEDMTSMVRRNPIPALLVAVGVGFLLARATAPRSY
jgi:hypothetical protein